MIDWKLSTLTVLGVLLSVLLGHLLAKRREKDRALNQRIIEFKELLLPAIIELENSNQTPAEIVLKYFPDQDKEARKLALHLPNHKSEQFSQRWKVYSDLHKEKEAMGLTAMIAIEVDDPALADPKTEDGIVYIKEQNLKRRQEVIAIINNALSAL